MSTSKRQQLFASLLPRLIDYIYEQGYACTLGDAFRDDRVPYGHANSLHRKRLAIDLNLFKDGKYLQETEDHAPFGEYWCSLHPDNRWGGMDGGDGNHYSHGAEYYHMTY